MFASKGIDMLGKHGWAFDDDDDGHYEK